MMLSTIKRYNNKSVSPAELAIVKLIHGLEMYKVAYSTEWKDSSIHDDYVLGPAFVRIVQGVRELLNGATGSLDCGDADSKLLALLPEEDR